MALTVAEIDEFRAFAVSQLNQDGISSLSDCIRLWEEKREFEESVAGIRESMEDIAAGRTKPLDQAFEDIRQDLGFSPKPTPS